MKWTIALFGLIILSGCTANRSASTRQEDPKKLIAVDDAEARSLGYPATFISKEKKKIDWKNARSAKYGDMPVKVIDGATVEVCGGLCDR